MRKKYCMPKNVFYAQSGGVTSVINATACGVWDAVEKNAGTLGKLYFGHCGILGALEENLIDASELAEEERYNLLQTPAGAFGSCRYKLSKSPDAVQRIIEVFRAHDIGYCFYNGGGDSQDTSLVLAQKSKELNYPLTCIGIPKTIDNDLPHTDCCPGFGSVAKYTAIATLEAGLDVKSMSKSSTKVFILEVMGRNAGWIAASSALAQMHGHSPPHIILFPEIAFEPKKFIECLQKTIKQHGFCVVVASEGIRTEDKKFLSQQSTTDAFGHAQLGGVASKLAAIVKDQTGYKCHWAIPDYLQRSARHIASKVDVEQAYALGKEAVELAVKGVNSVMPIIKRLSDTPYQWEVASTTLDGVANIERMLPRDYISDDGFHVTEKAINYLAPLIEGESFPKFNKGIPVYANINPNFITKKLTGFTV